MGRFADEPRVDPGRPARRELRHLHGLGRDPRVRRQRLRRGLPRALHLGPAADGGQPGPAGLRQGAVGRGDRADDRVLCAVVRGSGAGVRQRRSRQRVPAHPGEHRGRAARRAPAGATRDARGAAGGDHDGGGGGAALLLRAGRAAARGRRAGLGRGGVRGVSGHDPRGQAPAQRVVCGQGRGGAGRIRDRLGRAAGVQPAGRGPHAGAGERRRALDEAGQRRGRFPRGGRRLDSRLLRAPGPPDGGVPARAAGACGPVAGMVLAGRGGPGGRRRSRPTRPTSTGTT